MGCSNACSPSFSPTSLLFQCAAGNHFCTAKELTEEIRSLTLEREGLEGLLHKLLVLSSRNVQKLGSVKEDYSRLRQELDQGRAAYGKWSHGCPMQCVCRYCAASHVPFTVEAVLEPHRILLPGALENRARFLQRLFCCQSDAVSFPVFPPPLLCVC